MGWESSGVGLVLWTEGLFECFKIEAVPKRINPIEVDPFLEA